MLRIFVSEICSLEDCRKYIDTYNKTFGGGVSWDNPIYELPNDVSDVEIDFNMKSTQNSGVGMHFGAVKASGNSSIRPIISAGTLFISAYDGNGSETQYSQSQTYSANDTISIVLKRIGTTVIGKINNVEVMNTTLSYSNLFKYLLLVSWSSKTVTITGLKIKPL